MSVVAWILIWGIVVACAAAMVVGCWLGNRWDRDYAEAGKLARGYLIGQPSLFNEAVLLGPVSAWVAEGEARALCQWAANNAHCDAFGCGLPSTEPDCDDCEWEELRVLEQWEPVGYVRVRTCGVCPATRDRDMELPADISGIPMTEIR